MLIAGMMTGLVGGCGAKGADQTEGTETAAEGATEEAAKTLPSHQIGETFTENINGTDVSFIMMDLDRAGVEMPVPSSLIDPTRYRGGVATEDDWNNYIICEPEDIILRNFVFPDRCIQQSRRRTVKSMRRSIPMFRYRSRRAVGSGSCSRQARNR